MIEISSLLFLMLYNMILNKVFVFACRKLHIPHLLWRIYLTVSFKFPVFTALFRTLVEEASEIIILSINTSMDNSINSSIPHFFPSLWILFVFIPSLLSLRFIRFKLCSYPQQHCLLCDPICESVNETKGFKTFPNWLSKLISISSSSQPDHLAYLYFSTE